VPATTSTHGMGGTYRGRKVGRSLVVAVALVVAALAVFAAEAGAGSFDSRPPEAVLMKGQAVLQTGQRGSYCWSWYDEAIGDWKGLCADTFSYAFPRADGLLKAGARLHVRLAKPERPEKFRITAYRGFDKKDKWPVGKGRRLNTIFEPVKRDGETVAWNVYFRVNQPDRHYYLDTFAVWGQVPNTHVSAGDATYTFHVKTRA
jgi:hypothetical protein